MQINSIQLNNQILSMPHFKQEPTASYPKNDNHMSIGEYGAYGWLIGGCSTLIYDGYALDIWKIMIKKIGIGILLGVLTGYFVNKFDKKAEENNNKKDFYEKCSTAAFNTGAGAVIGATLSVVSAGNQHYFEWAKGKKFEYAGGMLGAMLFGAHAWMDVYQHYKHSKLN